MSHSDIRLDFNRAIQDSVGKEGISISQIDQLTPSFNEIYHGLRAIKEIGQLPFYHLPFEEDAAKQILQTAEDCKERFDTLVILGIGGSALGAQALYSALRGAYFNFLPAQQRAGHARVLICDNIDPDYFDGLLNTFDLQKTLFNVVSKSGETLETLSQFLVVQEVLKQKIGLYWKEHLIITTDAEKGMLRQIAQSENLRSLSIPHGVGGRFSVLSSVGLFPAAMAGIDILEILAGARRAEAMSAMKDLWLNPAAMLAALQYLMSQNGKNILVVMPYSNLLLPTAEWYGQLWAESIGKRFSLKGKEIHTGSTPVSACGTRDQHSQLQLYMEGPRDKFILLMKVENFKNKILIPAYPMEGKKLEYLHHQTLNEILNAEALATETALQSVGRPSAKILIPHLTPYLMGQLLFLLEMTTAFAGGFYNVNPFDQPGVELGKKLAQGVLGKEGFETYRKEVSESRWDEKFVV